MIERNLDDLDLRVIHPSDAMFVTDNVRDWFCNRHAMSLRGHVTKRKAAAYRENFAEGEFEFSREKAQESQKYSVKRHHGTVRYRILRELSVAINELRCAQTRAPYIRFFPSERRADWWRHRQFVRIVIFHFCVSYAFSRLKFSVLRGWSGRNVPRGALHGICIGSW
jgi:hypothetical protein